MGDVVVNPNRRTVIRWAAFGAVAAAVEACKGGSPRSVAAPSSQPVKSTPHVSSTPAPARLAGAAATEVVSGPRTAKAVALTFHTNGDVSECHELVKAANDNGAHITAMAVGNWLAANPSFVASIRDGGHEWGNHTWAHLNTPTLTAQEIYDEAVRCRDVLVRLTGSPARWYRPSAMDHATALVLAQAGKAGYATSVSYDVDPSDYKDPGSRAVVERTLAAAKPGSIVSLHMGHAGTITALPQIITGLRARGLECVTLTELLG